MKKMDWSCGLEHGEYAENKDLVIKEALEAVAETAKGYFVNLVTPNSFGHPDDYLTPILAAEFAENVSMEYIDQCGCGGYVLRVTVL